MVWDSDVHYFKSHYPSHNISLKMQTQSSKDFFCSKKLKLKDPKSALSHDNTAELPEINDKKDKKKRFQD